ncbi:uncharacterized protein LOC144443737 [Glandiceps talaboti]
MVNQSLNNEVVHIRPVVRRAKVIVTHHLIRRAKHLRSKKGSDEQKAKNERRADRMMNEIEVIKDLKPDGVIKKALKEDITLQHLDKPTATAEERAVARVICHDIVKKCVDKVKEKYSQSDFDRLQKKISSKNVNTKKRQQKKPGSRSSRKMERQQQKADSERKDEGDQKTNDTDDEEDDSDDDSGNVDEGDGSDDVDEGDDGDDVDEGDDGDDVDEGDDVDDVDEEAVENKKQDDSVNLTNDLASGAKADSNFKSARSKEKSLFFSDSDNEQVSEEKQKRTASNSSRNVVDFKVMGKRTLQSTFHGSLSSAATGQERRYNKQPDRRKDAPRQNSRSKPNHNGMRTERQGRANPCKADLGVKRKSPVKRKEDIIKAQTSSTQSIHPSWEASRKRREQETAVVKFQGKKIKFDDDED